MPRRRRRLALGGLSAAAIALLALPGAGHASAGATAGATDGFCAGNGHVTVLDQTADEGMLHAMAVQPDGGFLVMGGASDSKILVKRFNPDGTPDTAFGSRILAPTGAWGAAGAAVAVDHEGRILVLGFVYQDPFPTSGGYPPFDIGVWRLLPSGEPDPSFGDNGYAVFGDGDKLDQSAWFLAVDSKDRPVVTGEELTPAAHTTVGLMVRFTSAGQPDTTFNRLKGKGGIAYFELPEVDAILGDLAVQPDGKVVVRRLPASGRSPMSILRIVPGDVTGTGAAMLDPHFGAAGTGRVDIKGLAGGEGGLLLQGDGGILAFGTDRGYLNPAIARLSPAGRVDRSYGQPAGAKIPVPGTNDAANYREITDVQPLPLGGVVITGLTVLNDQDGRGQHRAYVARLGAHGALDKRFGRHGLRFLALPSQQYPTLALTPGGRVLVAHARFDVQQFGNQGLVYRLKRDLTVPSCA